ncbi:Cell wall assembly regulator [Steccherinum ochraceum]|uniref:Cell wall assembly regulator n=1 Tax=Steccherinum ochraceum TaxID=92696 RepID=A0A4R0R739_9APHY|nr:Cell wall assembly regulator [Steccherinum ochraceum]
MSSTHEAFSLPTSSPGLPHHPDAFVPDTLQSSDSVPSPTSYSYPPQSPGAYDYVPAATRSRQSTLVPVHGSQSSYPPLEHTWNRLRAWLSKEYPELGDTLNFGILPQDLAQIEMAFGFQLPVTIRESYLYADGQEPESSAGCSEGLFFGLTLLPLENVLEEWSFWREVDEDPNTGANERLRSVMESIPPGWVKREYSSRGWIPLVADKAGNYLGVDMNPGEDGAPGQVIVFGRDFDTKVVMWRGDGPGGWAKFLAGFVDDLEAGDGFEMGGGSEGSEGSEDGIGYENYFFDGVGRGLGDGGGDIGSGGMRLTGEYRGWNVLEAWADKSVRRWQETGVIPNPTEPPLDKGKERVRPPTLNLPSGSAAEVPIPVLNEDDAPTPLANSTNRELYSARQPPLPTISVTKPPVPLPVNLPTEDDLITPVEAENQAVMQDLEAGIGVMMQEIEQHSAAAHVSPPPVLSISTSNTLREAASVPLPASPAPREATSPGPISSPVINLLEDSAPILPTPPIIPSSPNEKHAMESPVLISTEEVLEKDPDTTLRIVGGAAGVPIPTDESLSGDAVLVSTTVPEEPSDFTRVSLSDAPPKSEKRSSIALGLKKIGNMGGGKRKKDSVSSVKEVV